MANFQWESEVYDRLAMIQRINGVELLERMALLTPALEPQAVLAPVRSILDIGCGTGILSAYLARHAPHATVTGIDLSPAMVQRARTLAIEKGLSNLQVVECDALHLAPSASYDLAISNFTLHWIRNATRVLLRISDAMRHGATLALQFPLVNQQHPMVSIMERAIPAAGLARHFQDWDFPWFRTSAEGYGSRLEQAGFRVGQLEVLEDAFELSEAEFHAFYQMVGLPVYLAGLTEAEQDCLLEHWKQEARKYLATHTHQIQFQRLIAVATKV